VGGVQAQQLPPNLPPPPAVSSTAEAQATLIKKSKRLGKRRDWLIAAIFVVPILFAIGAYVLSHVGHQSAQPQAEYIIGASQGDFLSANGQQVIYDDGQSLSYQTGWDDEVDNRLGSLTCESAPYFTRPQSYSSYQSGCQDALNYSIGVPPIVLRDFPGDPH